MTIREIGRRLRTREISCLDLIRQTLADIRKRDQVFHSFITLMEEQALLEAAERDRELAAGIDRGPLHGIPIAHKDLICTRGVLTTAGSLLFRRFVPDYDATVVRKLRDTGAICVGKTNLHELAYGVTSSNPHFGFVLNPRDPARIPGGSSGGSAAAVAAGFLPLALGTDTGGSIRIPASFCGIVGLKPTYELVSRHGVLPLAFSLDHVGPLGSCVEDCALAMDAIAGPGFDLSASPDMKGLRVGIPENFYFDGIDGEVATAVHRSLSEMERLGASVSQVSVPDIEEANSAARIVQLVETASVYAHHNDRSLFGDDVWALLEQGRMIPGHEYVSAQRVRTLYRRDFDALWKRLDILVSPATPTAAPRLDQKRVTIGSREEDTRMASTRLVRAINFFGEPALSMPCGETSSGLPIGLQLIGAPFTDPALLRVAQTLETALRGGC